MVLPGNLDLVLTYLGLTVRVSNTMLWRKSLECIGSPGNHPGLWLQCRGVVVSHM